MDGNAGLAAGLLGAFTSVTTALINRGAAAGAKECAAQLEKLVGPDAKFTHETKFPADTVVGKIQARVLALEAALLAAAAVAALPGQVEALRAYVTEQLKLALARVEQAEAAANAARRARTGSQPALVDDEARRGLEDLQRRLEGLERAREEDRASFLELQLQLKKLDTILELYLDGSLVPGGKSAVTGGKSR